MIHVCSLAALPDTVKATGASHVLTVMAKVEQVQRPESVRPENHLKVAMDDITEQMDGFVAPSDSHIEQVLAFARAGGVNPASIANLFGTEVINASSVLDSVDGKLTGTLFNLPGGPVGAAVGLSWRRESLSAHTDPNGFNTVAANPAAQSWIGGQFNDPFSRSRTIEAAFVELRAPLTSEEMHVPGFHAFDLIGAVRGERYSDAGDSVVPKR